jgi:hypothetical protein
MNNIYLQKKFSKKNEVMLPETVAGSKCQRGLGPNSLFGNH